MTRQKVYRNHVFPSSIMGFVTQMWKRGLLCDAVLKTGSTLTKAHRLVLLAASPVLRCVDDAALESELVVRLSPEIRPSSVDTFLQHIYEGCMMLTEDNYKDVDKIARLLQVDSIIKCCEDFINSIGKKNSHKVTCPENTGEIFQQRTTAVQSGKNDNHIEKTIGNLDINIHGNKRRRHQIDSEYESRSENQSTSSFELIESMSEHRNSAEETILMSRNDSVPGAALSLNTRWPSFTSSENPASISTAACSTSSRSTSQCNSNTFDNDPNFFQSTTHLSGNYIENHINTQNFSGSLSQSILSDKEQYNLQNSTDHADGIQSTTVSKTREGVVSHIKLESLCSTDNTQSDSDIPLSDSETADVKVQILLGHEITNHPSCASTSQDLNLSWIKTESLREDSEEPHSDHGELTSTQRETPIALHLVEYIQPNHDVNLLRTDDQNRSIDDGKEDQTVNCTTKTRNLEIESLVNIDSANIKSEEEEDFNLYQPLEPESMDVQEEDYDENEDDYGFDYNSQQNFDEETEGVLDNMNTNRLGADMESDGASNSANTSQLGAVKNTNSDSDFANISQLGAAKKTNSASDSTNTSLSDGYGTPTEKARPHATDRVNTTGVSADEEIEGISDPENNSQFGAGDWTPIEKERPGAMDHENTSQFSVDEGISIKDEISPSKNTSSSKKPKTTVVRRAYTLRNGRINLKSREAEVRINKIREDRRKEEKARNKVPRKLSPISLTEIKKFNLKNHDNEDRTGSVEEDFVEALRAECAAEIEKLKQARNAKTALLREKISELRKTAHNCPAAQDALERLELDIKFMRLKEYRAKNQERKIVDRYSKKLRKLKTLRLKMKGVNNNDLVGADSQEEKESKGGELQGMNNDSQPKVEEADGQEESMKDNFP